MAKTIRKSKQHSSRLGKCALCQKSRVLQDSHIVPEFLYKPLYIRPRHTLNKYLGGKLIRERRPIQKGIRERLLCTECEQVFEKWETHVSRVLQKSGISVDLTKPLLTVKGFLYWETRLFFLSILWRMSVAKGVMWKGCVVADRDKELIRMMLLNQNPCEFFNYPIFCMLPRVKGQFFDDFMVLPATLRDLDDTPTVHVVLSGVEFVFRISSITIFHPWASLFLREEKKWTWRICDGMNMPLFGKAFAQCLDERIAILKAERDDK